jgi:hypothetical protein
MNRDEVRFRTSTAARRLLDRTAAVVAPPKWARAALSSRLRPGAEASRGPGPLAYARRSLAREDWFSAHEAFAAHFASRTSNFPVDAQRLDSVAARIREAFPDAEAHARQRGANLLRGSYDLLGYSGVSYGVKPDWHLDAVSGRRAPLEFWADVPYFAPECGDHKVTWELNRHQHWLQLGRAFKLTKDRLYYERFVSELDSWIAANPPLTGTNWASMLEIGLRTISWLWAIHFFSAAASKSDRFPWLVDLLLAIHKQLEHVSRNLSRYVSLNTHLTGGALALYGVGRNMPELRDSHVWASTGLRVLAAEARNQIAPDGGHVELSAHYHRYSTDFYLLALAIARTAGDGEATEFERAARVQAHYLRTICDVHGRRPFTGDDDGGQLFPICGRPPEDCTPTLAAAAVMLEEPALALGPPVEETYWFCGRVPENRLAGEVAHWPSTILKATGYYVSRTSRGDHLIFDAGPHGHMDGGHAHADALSVTLSVAGVPFLIDPGTATYTMQREIRDRFRSTAMHNTVTVNGRAQSLPRGPFHWSSVATARAVVGATGNGCDYFEGAHDGYHPVVHTRAVLAVHDVGWFFVDCIAGADVLVAEAYWHLHPAWKIVSEAPGAVALRSGESTITLLSSEKLQVLGLDGRDPLAEVSLAYGRIEPSTTLRSTIRGPGPLVLVTCAAPEWRTGAVERLAVTHAAPQGWCSSAFRIVAPRAEITLLSAIEPDAVEGTEPGVLWGTDGFRTDGRLACLIQQNDRPAEAVVVHGRRILDATGLSLLEVPHPSKLVRSPLSTVRIREKGLTTDD